MARTKYNLRKNKKNRTRRYNKYRGGMDPPNVRRSKRGIVEVHHDGLIDEAALKRSHSLRTAEIMSDNARLISEYGNLHKKYQTLNFAHYPNVSPLKRRDTIIQAVFMDKKQGNCSSGYNGRLLSRETIQDVCIKQITKFDTPYSVNIPTGGQNHNILIHAKHDAIWISDWKGNKFLTSEGSRVTTVDNRKVESFTNYKEVITQLQHQFHVQSVKFYFIDPYILVLSLIKSRRQGETGGCSEYFDLFRSVYYKTGDFEWPFNESSPPTPIELKPSLQSNYVLLDPKAKEEKPEIAELIALI